MNRKSLKSLILVGILLMTFAIASPCYADVTPKATQAIEKVKSFGEFATKQPIGKRQIAMKFILAMFGVATSSIVIFVLLLLYNKFFYSGGTTKIINEEDIDFKTPTNMKDAINIFLKKTK